uniref:BTB domain-containing protein n=1 Tax=Panagrolaimus davidi TaxID=227884 RepID=A0A914QP49_9BILA
MSESVNLCDDSLSEAYMCKMQKERCEIFKFQDPETGHFDVIFEVEGKQLYAHKFIITPISEYMNAMLSDRWKTNDDEPIRIETYTFDNFYEFLCFIYSGNCNITKENAFQLTDMAEYYGVACLKEFCDIFLSTIKYNVETIEEMVEFSIKYFMTRMQAALKVFICSNLDEVVSNERFASYKKSVVEVLASVDDSEKKEKIFEAVYKWIENQVVQQYTPEAADVNLLEVIKDELCATFPHIYFKNKIEMKYDFLLNFIVEKGFHFSPDEFKALYLKFHYDYSRFVYDVEKCFKCVYDLAEKQALQKQRMALNGEGFSVADSVKADLVKVIPIIKFYLMKENFLMDFVVAKGVITAEQASHVYDTRVCISNYGSCVTGVFKDDLGILSAYNKHESYFRVRRKSTTKLRFIQTKFLIPSTPSTVEKMVGVDWYLCLDKDGVLTFKHHSMIHLDDYLIAEMKSKNGFHLTADELTLLTASYNNI